MNTNLNYLTGHANAVAAKADALLSEAGILRQAVADLQEQEAQLAELQARAANLQASLATAEADLLTTQADLSAEATQRLAAQQVLAETQQQVLLQLAEVERLRTEVTQREAQIVLLYAEIASLEAQLRQPPVDPPPPPPAPTYRLTSSALEVDEGGAIAVTLATTGLPPGTTIGYLITGVSAADLAGPGSGRLLIGDDGTASITVRLAADLTTEGPETLRLALEGVPGELTVIVRDTSTTPAPPPVEPPVVYPPVPLDEGVRYRYQHRRLLQPQSIWLPKIPNGVAYTDGQHSGATAVFVAKAVGWAWDKKGGDWVDANGVRYGAKPWASMDISTEAEHSTDVTALVNAPGWLAVILRSNAQRKIAGKASQTPPRIEMVLEDGTKQVRPCWYSGSIDGSSTVPNPNVMLQQMPAILEFDRADAPVRSARLFLTSSGLATPSGGPARIDFFKVDPPINKDEPTQGLAAAFPMDEGIEQHPAVLGAHVYKDGTTIEQFVSKWVGNIDDERNFDPALYGTGPEDRTKLPWVDQGKWIGAGPDWTLVDSTYRGEGFVPFADGYGALRIFMAPAHPIDQATGERSLIHNGGQYGYDGTGAAGAKIYLPADRFGRQRRMFVRTNVRLARGDGFVDGVDGRLQVYAAAGQAKWVDHAGKTLPMPIHNRTTGGFSGSGGGGAGWQARCSWAHNDAMQGGPDEGGWVLGAHTFDFGAQNPPGHNYQGSDTSEKTQYGQRGGLGGVLYYDRWYSFEAEILLNSVDQPATLPDGTPHMKYGVRQFWTADGAWRVWIDGRLAFERTGMVFRSLPVMDPGFRAGYCRPCRELGAEGLMLNWFHGGVTQNAQPRAMFLSSVVWAEERIGPTSRP